MKNANGMEKSCSDEEKKTFDGILGKKKKGTRT